MRFQLRLGCAALLSRKFVAAWKETFSGISWERTPLACMWWPSDRRLHAGSVRSQESGPLRVSAVKSLVAARLHCVHLLLRSCGRDPSLSGFGLRDPVKSNLPAAPASAVPLMLFPWIVPVK